MNRKYTGSVSAVQTADKSIDIKFVFPFAYNNETIKTINQETGQPYGLVPKQSADDDNKILMIDTEESIAFTDTMTYLDWYSLNDCKDEDKTKYQAGILLETVDNLTPDSDGNVVTLSNEEYKALYEAETGSLATAKSNATAQIRSHHEDTAATEYKVDRGGKQISYLFAPVADIKNLDDKNSIEYAYSFANISQSGTSENPTPTVRKNKVYRAFSYLYADGTIIISDPIYFTIYDMASISTGEAYIAPANNG